mmetsp:Transcript_24431/g.40989  ORF Transcript_24431/g.40989 Transcript_24431/m.40989 type:complete len:165 (+) Transcript_24431:155-649(+)
MHRLCFESVLWNEGDALLYFKDAANTRKMLAHISGTKNITSVELSGEVVYQTVDYHARMENKKNFTRKNWERGLRDALRCLIVVLKTCPSICTLSVTLSQGHIPKDFISALVWVPLTTFSIESCQSEPTSYLRPISYDEFTSVIIHCRTLTNISLNFGQIFLAA